MRRLIISAHVILAATLLSGCSSSIRSPMTPPGQLNRTGVGEAVVIGGATAAGAGAGYAITGDATGAAIGGVAGLAGGAVLNNVMANKKAQRELEVFEAGRREERTTLMREYWEAERMSSSGTGVGIVPTGSERVEYPAGYWEGVNLAPRSDSRFDPLTEPRRP